MNYMGIEAVAAYLRALVEGQPDLTLARVSRAAGVSANYLSRLGTDTKNKTKEPSARVLLKLVRAARGKVEHLEELLYSDTATPEEGKYLAERWRADMRQASSEDERRQILDRLIAELESDPRKLDQWIGYGARLRDEDQQREGR